MALSDLVPASLRAKPIGVKGPTSPRVSGVSDEALTPVVEHVAGPVFAYRGQEQHGVPVTHGTEDPHDPHAAFSHTVDVEHVTELHPPTPVLVKVVEDDGTESHAFRVFSTAANGSPSVIVNRQDGRSRVLLDVTTANHSVYIGHDSTVSVFSGFPLSAAASLPMELVTDQAIWAVSDDGSAVDVRVLIEFPRG